MFIFLNSVKSEQVRNKQDSLEEQANPAFTLEVAQVAKQPQSWGRNLRKRKFSSRASALPLLKV